VAGTALTYKKKVSESVKAAGEGLKLKEELTRRGQGWKKLAESRQSKYAILEKDFRDSAEALELMAKRYHEDCTNLAKRCLVLEFKEKTQAPAIAKALKEATRLRHIATIREMLEGKRPTPALSEEAAKAAGVGKPADGAAPTMATKKGDKKKAGEGEVVADEPGKVTNESVKTEPQASAPAPLTEAKTSEAKLVYHVRDPRSIDESVALVQRLSQVSA
jgi:hypothetical protein